MHEKSIERIEREKKQKNSCDICDIKRNTETLLKSHKKAVHGDIKRNLSEMRRGPKITISPPSLSPPFKKVKEEVTIVGEDDLTERIEKLKKRKGKQQDPATSIKNSNIEIIAIQKKEIDNLNRLLTASGEVIANLENENNNLNSKSEFYEEVAEGLVIENESQLLKLQQLVEQTQENNSSQGKVQPRS